jgi:hypothetical protein
MLIASPTVVPMSASQNTSPQLHFYVAAELPPMARRIAVSRRASR